MTGHDRWRELVSARHDGELDAAGMSELAAHLPDCAECTAYAEGLRGLGALARELPVEDMPGDLAARIAAALPHARVGRRRWRWRVAVPALGAVLATLLVALLGGVDRLGVFPLPQAAAAEPLRHLTSLYAERVIEAYSAPPEEALTRRTVERVWFQAPDRLRVEQDVTEPGQPLRRSVVVRVAGAQYESATGLTTGRPPQIELPEPLSVTVPLLGRLVGPGAVVAGRPTRVYELQLPGSLVVRTALVDSERPTLLGVEQSVILGKDNLGDFQRGRVSKHTRVVRYNEPIPASTFALPAQPSTDLGFHAAALHTLGVRPAAVPEGFRLVSAGRGPDGEAAVYAQGALLVLATLSPTGDDLQPEPEQEEGIAESRPSRESVSLGDGRSGVVELDLYAVPRIRLTYRGAVLTVAAPLGPSQLAALVRQMYPE